MIDRGRPTSACPGCGYRNRTSARFCADCGEALAAETACPDCGVRNPSGHRHCDACGAALGSGSAEVTAPRATAHVGAAEAAAATPGAIPWPIEAAGTSPTVQESGVVTERPPNGVSGASVARAAAGSDLALVATLRARVLLGTVAALLHLVALMLIYTGSPRVLLASVFWLLSLILVVAAFMPLSSTRADA